MSTKDTDPAPLFRPFSVKSLTLPNRIAMAPMTRQKSPGGVPGQNVADYYRRRAEGGVGLIITEGTIVHGSSEGSYPNVPHFYGEAALAGWKNVVKDVHAAGGKIFPQLWHIGLIPKPDGTFPPQLVGPSGLAKADTKVAEPMTAQRIDDVIQAFGQAAADAQRIGFDGVELHGAHGYLIDQFFWEATNLRDANSYGGDAVARTRFAAEVVKEVRRRTSPDYPICLRFSQWKQQDFAARLATTPQALEKFLAPLTAAGVDIFHASQRRFWEPEFDGSTLNLAGWTKKLTGKATMTVGSVTLNQEFIASYGTSEASLPTDLNELLARLGADEFDLVAVGRALIVNPDWPKLIQRGGVAALKPYSRDVLTELV